MTENLADLRRSNPEKYEIEIRKRIYKEGTRLRLESWAPSEVIDDNENVPPGTFGTVVGGFPVDDAGTIFVQWDNGRTIGVTVGDKARVVQSHDITIVDDEGREIRAGERVRLAGWPRPGEHDAAQAHGIVLCVTDPDGDVDDEGRSYGIPPQVEVRFDDGVEDSFRTTWLGGFYEDAPFRVDDVEAT